jgi:hypothetical protein
MDRKAEEDAVGVRDAQFGRRWECSSLKSTMFTLEVRNVLACLAQAGIWIG